MNLFWKKTFATLQSTAKYEAAQAETLDAMQRYDEVEKSLELEEYRALFHVVKSADFIEKKKILQNRQYKDTEEYRHWKKYEKLEKNAEIKDYYHILKSETLQLFLSFKATPEFEHLGDKKKVKASERLQTLKKYSKSREYKIYVRFHNSYIIKEYEELKERVATPEFKKANAFWSNPQRWQTTPEYQQEQRYYTLHKNPDIQFFNNEKPERFKRLRSLVPTFTAEFERNIIDKQQWEFGFHYVSDKLIGNHSFTNEKQANTGGKNTVVEDGLLKILTKNEKTIACAWDFKRGFVEKDFDYTADVLQTANTFRQKYGVFQAKIRCSGNLHHAFWLGSDKKLPHVNIFHFNGKNITLGNVNKNLLDGTTIKGISHSAPYIYTLVWTEKELVWLINNLEVYRTSSDVPQQSLYLALNSFISEKQKGSTGSLEIDWLRVFSVQI